MGRESWAFPKGGKGVMGVPKGWEWGSGGTQEGGKEILGVLRFFWGGRGGGGVSYRCR